MSSQKPKTKKTVRFAKTNAKAPKSTRSSKTSKTLVALTSEDPLFEKEENSEEDSDYSDIENDLNNDDASQIKLNDDGDEDEEEIKDKEHHEDSDKEDTAGDNGDSDDSDEDDEYIAEVARQNEDSNLLQHTRVIKTVQLTKPENFIAPNIFSRYEQAATICMRAAHLEKGAPPFVDTSDQSNELGIVVKEMMQGEIPYMIARRVGNQVEWHSGADLMLNTNIMNILKDYQ